MLQLSRISKLKQISPADLCIVSAVLLILSGSVLAQQPGQKTFASAEDAGQALLVAAQSGGQTAMLEIFGPAATALITTSDSDQDQKIRDEFVAEYKEMHRIVQEPDGTTTLYIGAENWPVPVPLVEASGVWHFDTEAGKKEILFRRIGRNEYAAIDVCHVLVSAQGEYYSQPRDGKVQQYAQVLASDEGRHNGLFWKTADGEPESPIGPLLAYATSPGNGKQEEENSPFHGYYFQILTRVRTTAQVDAKSYIVNGEMIAGFSFLAYPADYRSSGVMTFIVDQTGVVYQKDLGDKTAQLASAITEYAPDETWKKAE
jgi:hypothetical protein